MQQDFWEKKVIREEQQKVISPWLKRFDYISVRESSGIDICQKKLE